MRAALTKRLSQLKHSQESQKVVCLMQQSACRRGHLHCSHGGDHSCQPDACEAGHRAPGLAGEPLGRGLLGAVAGRQELGDLSQGGWWTGRPHPSRWSDTTSFTSRPSIWQLDSTWPVSCPLVASDTKQPSRRSCSATCLLHRV